MPDHNVETADAVETRDDWDRYWDEYATSAEHNPAQRYRRRLILPALELAQAGSGARVLDIGSGQGDFAAQLKVNFPEAQVLGLELSASGVQIARGKVPGATFRRCDLVRESKAEPEWQAWATHAVCSEVLEHLDEPARFLTNARQWMAPGCRLAVTVPGGPMSEFDRYIGHRRHYTAVGLEQLLRETGYRVEKVRTAGFPFFNCYRLVVLLRGNRLIQDVAARKDTYASGSARMAMTIFQTLFHFNLSNCRLGWQMVAVARVPER